MAQLIPAVLEQSYKGVVNKITRVRPFVKTVQLDICDGLFVPSYTWPYIKEVLPNELPFYENKLRDFAGEIAEMPYLEDLNYELDMMIANPKKFAVDFLPIGPTKMIFHYETLENPLEDLKDLRKQIPNIVDIGIAINTTTNPEVLFPLLEEGYVTSVQCMGIEHIGKQGEPFDPRVLENLKVLRAKYPDLTLSVDGAVTKETITQLKDAGATELVSGSAIWKDEENIRAAIAELQSLI